MCNIDILGNFSALKSFLGDKVKQGESFGLNDKQMTNFATHLGDYLSEHVTPENSEEKLLQQLWQVASEEEQKAIASVMVKFMKQNE